MLLSDLVKLVRSNPQTLLTGAGGVGKTHALRRICSRFTNVVYLGSTNQSAILIGGETVHSFFRLGVCADKQELEAYDAEYIRWFCKNVKNDLELAQRTMLKKLRGNLYSAKLIVIDEVSMVSAEMLNLIYYRARMLEMDLPPILFVGDLFQLPPVKKEGKGHYIFKSKNFNPKIIELTKIRRTDNLEFAEAQKRIRRAKYTREVASVIDTIINSPYVKGDYNATTLCATNAQASAINEKSMESLKTTPVTFEGKVEVFNNKLSKKMIDTIVGEFNAEKTLTLKPECRVIITQNNKELNVYNGLQGTFKRYNADEDTLEIETDAGATIQLERGRFNKQRVREGVEGIEYAEEVAMTQFPVRLAYAITIHKSQGMSMNKLIIDCNRIFSPGQFYVAISRARDPYFIKLTGFDPKYIRIENEAVSAYYANNKENIIFTPGLEDDAPSVELQEIVDRSDDLVRKMVEAGDLVDTEDEEDIDEKDKLPF